MRDLPRSGKQGADRVEKVIKVRSPMEKRKCPRFPVMLPAVFFGERAGGGLVVDVSLEGCCIRSAVPMQKGDYVRIRIDLIGDTLTGDLAVVRWSRKEHFGVELIRLASEQQARLRGFLDLFTASSLDESTTASTPHEPPG
jgi:PilZ domain